jgi:hypothetical protein
MPLAAPVTTATWPWMERLSWLRRRKDLSGMGRDRSATGRTALVDLGDLAQAVLLACVFAFPLALTTWALLDAARRPQWAWALAERRQVVWLAGILFGALTVVGGVLLCTYYLTRVRQEVAAAEAGDITR